MSYINDLKKYPKEHLFYREAMEMGNKFETDAYVKNGIVRWKSNDNVPPREVLELWDYLNKDFSFNDSINALGNATNEFLKQYKKQKTNSEQLHEMRSAFGKGTTVVNVITGKKTRL